MISSSFNFNRKTKCFPEHFALKQYAILVPFSKEASQWVHRVLWIFFAIGHQVP